MTTANEIVAIIPARGGSKRIPDKNIKSFSGKPIIAYSIRAAQDSGLFSRIIVTTDSSEIANIAIEYGAEVPFTRPKELANDYASTAEVVYHAIKWLVSNGTKPEVACCIYATAPFIQVDYLKLGYERLLATNATSVFSVTTYPYTIYRSLKITDNNRVKMIWPQYRKSRSQDMTEAYHDAGQFYWINIDKFMTDKELFSDDSGPVILPRYLVQDIDTVEDWETAEMMFSVIAARRKKVK